jgi:hypothetical protein
MDANLRQQTRRSAVWLIQQYFLQIVPKKGLLICASKLRIYKCLVMIYKLNLRMNFEVQFIYKRVYKCILSVLMSVLSV